MDLRPPLLTAWLALVLVALGAGPTAVWDDRPAEGPVPVEAPAEPSAESETEIEDAVTDHRLAAPTASVHIVADGVVAPRPAPALVRTPPPRR